jgi:hypothetical protein
MSGPPETPDAADESRSAERERLFREIAELRRQRNELMVQLAECRRENGQLRAQVGRDET